MKTSQSKKAETMTPARIYNRLYRRGSLIHARIRLANGRRTWRCCDTDNPKTAQKILRRWRDDEALRRHGIEPEVAALERNRLTVGTVIDDYMQAGCPDRKMRVKAPSTAEMERKSLQRVRAYFGSRAAVSLTLNDCDRFRDWRMSGGYTWQRAEKVRRSRAGNRSVDLELQALGNALALAVRRGRLKVDPLRGRTRYHREEDTRHCRECAPTPTELQLIEATLRQRNKTVIANCVMFLAFSGLRINEALPLEWEAVDWTNDLIHVKREKHGCNPWVPILPEMETLLRRMRAQSISHWLFPSPTDPSQPVPYITIASALTRVCRDLKIKHCTAHGCRSYFVTRCREAGLSDAEIAALIGDRTGPAIIARTYGDVLPTHLLKQAKRVQLLLQASQDEQQPKPELEAA